MKIELKRKEVITLGNNLNNSIKNITLFDT